MTRYRISPHFVVEEFDCHDGTQVPTAAYKALRLWAALWGEPLRAEFGAVKVTSGFRTGKYNRSVGGAPTSYHRYDLRYPGKGAGGYGRGVAADVVPARGSVRQWEAWAQGQRRRVFVTEWAGRGAFHGYESSGFIHLDTGPTRVWAG